MTYTKFTSGPWDILSGCYTPENGYFWMVQVADRATAYAFEEANANLIASAPDLYEASEPFDELATQRAVHSPEWRDSDTITVVVSIRALRAIKAARAKARGEA